MQFLERKQFIKKLINCYQILDFNNNNIDQTKKQERIEYFNQIMNSMDNTDYIHQYILPNWDLIFEMIENNIFRRLSTLQFTLQIESIHQRDQFVIHNPQFIHIYPVYQLFIQLLINDEISIQQLKQFITEEFIRDFLELFYSEDCQERKQLQLILLKLYAKLVPRRKIIRHYIDQYLQSIILESTSYYGAKELLEILVGIINGFSTPFRQEHINFFVNTLIPLHKSDIYEFFEFQLTRCIFQFLEKDQSLVQNLIESLLRYWPNYNSNKQILFLSELEKVIQFYKPNKMTAIIKKLFNRLIKCLQSSHLVIINQVSKLFENEYFLQIIYYLRYDIFPILIPNLFQISNDCWHEIQRENIQIILGKCQKIDIQLYSQYFSHQQYQQLKNQITRDQEILSQKWENLYRQFRFRKELPETNSELIT